LVFEVLLRLTNEEVREIYLILKAVEENQLVHPAKEWELDHFDERLINRSKINNILRKLRKSLSEEDARQVDQKVLLRKHSLGGEIDEKVYSKLEEAFNRKRRVEIEYFSIEEARAIKRRIDIYYKSRRYVVAFCHLRGAIRKFRTSRIINARLIDEKYAVPNDFDRREFL